MKIKPLKPAPVLPIEVVTQGFGCLERNLKWHNEDLIMEREVIGGRDGIGDGFLGVVPRIG